MIVVGSEAWRSNFIARASWELGEEDSAVGGNNRVLMRWSIVSFKRYILIVIIHANIYLFENVIVHAQVTGFIVLIV
jgi:hypothetical protein